MRNKNASLQAASHCCRSVDKCYIDYRRIISNTYVMPELVNNFSSLQNLSINCRQQLCI